MMVYLFKDDSDDKWIKAVSLEIVFLHSEIIIIMKFRNMGQFVDLVY